MACEFFVPIASDVVCANGIPRGLQLADRGRLFMMGYGVLIGAVLLVMVPVWFCVWRCSKYRKEKAEEEEYELQNQQQQQYSIYNHDRY